MTYLIYDTALNGQYTLMLLQKAYSKNLSLFAGTKDEKLSDVAPYIFLIDKTPEKISSPLLSLKAVVLVKSESNLHELVKHFQQFIYKKINNREHYFRFWDARVLRKFLPACNAQQLNNFFEIVDAFTMEDEDPEKGVLFELRRNKLYATLISSQKIPAVLNIETNDEGLQVYTQPIIQEQQTTKPKRKFFH